MEERLFMNSTGTESADLSPSFVRALTNAQLDLFASICVMLGNREAAKDVLQDTNVALMKHALEYDDNRAFLPWAKAFAFNQARTYRKRESRSPMVFDDDLVTAVAEETLDDAAESGRGRTDERRWRRLLPFSEVAGAVSEAKGEPWNGFVNRYGDPGRDLAIFVAWKRCGLTLREIGEHVGMKDKAVSYACAAIRKRLETDRELGLLFQRVLEKLGEVEN